MMSDSVHERCTQHEALVGKLNLIIKLMLAAIALLGYNTFFVAQGNRGEIIRLSSEMVNLKAQVLHVEKSVIELEGKLQWQGS